jgi:hypothetical protein
VTLQRLVTLQITQLSAPSLFLTTTYNMAAAIPAPMGLYSLLFGDASKWENFAPDYTVLSNYFGNGVPATSATQCCDTLAGLATCTPAVVALVSDTKCDKVYVAHTLTLFPVDVSNPTPLDELLFGLIGNSMDCAVPIVLPQAFFGLMADNIRVLEVTSIQGPDGHGAAIPVFCSGPHGAAAPETSAFKFDVPWSSLRLKLPLHWQALQPMAATPSWASSIGSCKDCWPWPTHWWSLPLAPWSSGGTWPAQTWVWGRPLSPLPCCSPRRLVRCIGLQHGPVESRATNFAT